MDFIKTIFGYVLEFFYNFTNNYGLALILFTIIVKVILFPLSLKGKKSNRGKIVLLEFAAIIMRSMKKNQKEGKPSPMGGSGAKMKLDGNVMKMLDGFTLLRASSMIGMVGATLTKEQLLKLNKQLNRIRKPKKLQK